MPDFVEERICRAPFVGRTKRTLGRRLDWDSFQCFGDPFGEPFVDDRPLDPLPSGIPFPSNFKDLCNALETPWGHFGKALHHFWIPFGKPILENRPLGPKPFWKSFLSLWDAF